MKPHIQQYRFVWPATDESSIYYLGMFFVGDGGACQADRICLHTLGRGSPGNGEKARLSPLEPTRLQSHLARYLGITYGSLTTSTESSFGLWGPFRGSEGDLSGRHSIPGPNLTLDYAQLACLIHIPNSILYICILGIGV